MYSTAELNAVELSPTKKDFYQIWNELLEVSGKLSARWDPTSTNESDPGIVLLKVLTAIADKLNYTIDANTLEAFMPSVAQEASMRKLCDMLGYSMRYFQAATTTARITYTGDTLPSNTSIFIDQFTNLKDTDGNINFVTTRAVSLSKSIRSATVDCMEGELVTCSTDNNNIISLANLDDNYRYYLPETQIASNGIFISDAAETRSFKANVGDTWKQCENLNTILLGNKYYKFGFDASMGLPYIQFPSDIGSLIGDGIIIRYIRTSGASGNIAVNVLSKLESPLSWSQTSSTTEDTSYLDVNLYAVSNIAPATNGANPETIDEAYWNYQKTIGTFDTLVTCRDYMNKIYRMITSDTTNIPLVSNINVTDIRSDINRTRQICTVESDGLAYPIIPLKNAQDQERITHFDLVLYPFTTVYNMKSKTEYIQSFKMLRGAERAEFNDIMSSQLADCKTISHKYCYPENADIACIKVYYQLSARISTTYKVTAQEAEEIEKIVHEALYQAFNMRKISFGEELPLDSILQTMEFADSRIKNVNIDDPKLKLVAALENGTEYTLVDPDNLEITPEAQRIYDDLVLSNVLAGRVALLHYDNTFKASLDESFYPSLNNPFTAVGDITEPIDYDPYYIPGQIAAKEQTIDNTSTASGFPALKQTTGKDPRPTITKIATAFEIDAQQLTPSSENKLALEQGEVISFRLPNFKTLKTYPGFINYYLQLNGNRNKSLPAVPATMITLQDFLLHPIVDVNQAEGETAHAFAQRKYKNLIDKFNSLPASCITWQTVSTKSEAQLLQVNQGWLFIKNAAGHYEYISVQDEEIADGTVTYYYVKLTDANYFQFYNWLVGASDTQIPLLLKTDAGTYEENTKHHPSYYQLALYTLGAQNLSNYGKFIDAKGNKYNNLVSLPSINVNGFATLSTKVYIPQLWAAADPSDNTAHTEDGLGRNQVLKSIAADSDYQLGTDEFLLLNYSSSEGQPEGQTVPVSLYLGPDYIIRPNFALFDSREQSSVSAYNKTTDLPQRFQTPDGSSYIDNITIPGMFTLNAREQIEHRELIQVQLDAATSYVYWILQDSAIEEFPFDETGKYILQAGEYFYYTDSVQQALAYYGAGTQISYSSTQVDTTGKPIKPKLFISADITRPTAEQIAENGLLATIPWQQVNLSKTPLTIREFQYINLTAGDTLISVELDNPVRDRYLTDKAVKVKSATYLQGNTQLQLPKVSLADYMWEVQTRVELNMSPTVPLKLRSHFTAGNILLAQSRLELYTADSEGNLKLCQAYVPLFAEPTVEALPPANSVLAAPKIELVSTSDRYVDSSNTLLAPILSVYANAVLLGTSGSLMLTGDLQELGSKLNLKLSEIVVPTDLKGQAISLGNTVDGLTLLTVPDEVSPTPFARFSAIVKPNTKGILTFYYEHEQPGTNNKSDITVRLVSAAGAIIASQDIIGNTLDKNYVLQEGLNTILFGESCSIELYRTSNSQKALPLLISPFQLVAIDSKKLLKLNPQLGLYQDTLKILARIQELAGNKFFYNNPIPTTIALDLNSMDATDTLRKVRNWFDPQNINNNFIVSEIEAPYLKEHIVVSKFSRSHL